MLHEPREAAGERVRYRLPASRLTPYVYGLLPQLWALVVQLAHPFVRGLFRHLAHR